MMVVDLVSLQKKNDARWINAKITRGKSFESTASKAFANKERYVNICRLLRALGSHIPDAAWVFIAVIHNRESNMNFATHLGQGDPLNRKTTHVPAGRGPFFGPDAFERGAVDALYYCAPFAARSNKDWSISGILTYLERYNGLAYARIGTPSPYIWAGTNQYVRGKVIVDHGPIVWNVVDQQLGCAGLILAILELDPATVFDGVDEIPLQPVLPVVDIVPVDGVFDTVWLQTSLNRLGTTPQLSVDGLYGGGTRIAVRAFQKAFGLNVDGIAGTQETIPEIKRQLKILEKKGV